MDAAFHRLTYNTTMKFSHLLILLPILFLFACQPVNLPTVTIIDRGPVVTLQTDARIPSSLLTEAGILINENDHVLSNGHLIAINESIDDGPITIQIRRAVTLTLVTYSGQQQIESSAFTVGDVLAELSIQLNTANIVDPPLSSPIENGMTITIAESRALNISVDGAVIQVQPSARTVGGALADAGIPLFGLDQAIPSENEALPSDGNIKVVRISESVVLTQKPIPFESEFVASAEVPLDQTQILSPGESGLSTQRIRIRYEDGQEVSRATEDETMVRPPKIRTLGYGMKIEVKTAVVDGVTIEYWRAVQMYATSYSPCRSGGDRCYPGTSSGKKLAKGMVALRYSWYLSMGGQPLYIPGYGYATVEDVCGGCVGKPWIDLGYSDDDFEAWHSWVTVYFLTPVPQSIVYILE